MQWLFQQFRQQVPQAFVAKFGCEGNQGHFVFGDAFIVQPAREDQFQSAVGAEDKRCNRFLADLWTVGREIGGILVLAKPFVSEFRDRVALSIRVTLEVRLLGTGTKHT